MGSCKWMTSTGATPPEVTQATDRTLSYFAVCSRFEISTQQTDMRWLMRIYHRKQRLESFCDRTHPDLGIESIGSDLTVTFLTMIQEHRSKSLLPIGCDIHRYMKLDHPSRSSAPCGILFHCADKHSTPPLMNMVCHVKLKMSLTKMIILGSGMNQPM